MAKKIQGWVDAGDVEKAEQHPDKYSHVLYTEQSQWEGITTKATLVIGEKVFTESEVRAMINAMVEQGENLKNLHGGIYKATATSTIREIAERHGIVLDPA